MRNSDEEPIKSVIARLLKAYRLQGKMDEMTLRTAWEKLMGTAIANRTTKIYLSKNTLFVNINSAALKQELNYSRGKIMELVNKELEREIVKEVVIR